MAQAQEHWNNIFAATDDKALGWYEADTSQTMKFIDRCGLASGSTVFIPGAGTSMLADRLAKSGAYLILNDISDRALDRLDARLGGGRYERLLHNIARPLPRRYRADLWVDRAVLHFLLEEADITAYFENVRRSVKKGGYVLLAEYPDSGASQCAGLDVHRYSVEEMQVRLGDDFFLVESEEYLFVHPSGLERPYIYALFRRQVDGRRGEEPIG